MTNPDNVGGLPELPETVWLDSLAGRLYTADQMRAYGELCRAAPAGGDVPRMLTRNEIDDLRRKAKQGSEYLANKMSAPAGSGEVEDWMVELFDEVYEREWNRAADEADDRHKAIIGPADRHATREAIAALLRKLQQGAEDPELLEDGRRYRYLMKRHPERCLGVDQLRAASQGQEGGHASVD